MKKKKDEFTLKDLFAIFIPKIWIIVIIAVLCGAAFGIYSSAFRDETYTANVKIMVTKDTAGYLTSSDRMLASDMVSLYEIVIESNDFLSLVLKEYNLKHPEYFDPSLTSESLAGLISVSQIGTTEVFVLSVTTNNPEKSLTLSKVLTEYIVNDELENNLQSKITYNNVKASVIDNANNKIAPNSKNVTRNAIIGFIAGAVISMVAIFVITTFDVVIRDRKKLDDNFDLPVLGIIPKFVVEEESA